MIECQFRGTCIYFFKCLPGEQDTRRRGMLQKKQMTAGSGFSPPTGNSFKTSNFPIGIFLSCSCLVVYPARGLKRSDTTSNEARKALLELALTVGAGDNIDDSFPSGRAGSRCLLPTQSWRRFLTDKRLLWKWKQKTVSIWYNRWFLIFSLPLRWWTS